MLLSSIISLLFPAKRGQTEDNTLPLKALPGLITLLDVALCRSVESQLTGTISSGHTLLSCWLDVKYEARKVLQLYKEKKYLHCADGVMSPYETLGWMCLETACNAIERLSTDRLASAANLSDPYDSIQSSAVSSGSNSSSSNNSNNLFYSSQASNLIGVGLQGIRNGILDSNERCETGRRQPTIQRRKDCGESPRLYCPDFVWADDVYFSCQKWIQNLDKHPLVQISHYVKNRVPSSADLDSSLFANTTISSGSNKTMKGAGSKSSRTSSRNGGSNVSSDRQQHRRRRKNEQEDKDRPPLAAQRRRSRPKVKEDWVELETSILVLVKLIQHDLPLRLYQFKAAMEEEAVVTKRLYLVKCEYRAPFRAFLEAHQNLLKAPPMTLVDCYLNKQQQDDDERSSSPEDIKAELQALLVRPELVELLSLEMEAEKLELDMGKMIFPFSELARTITNKRIILDSVSGIVDLNEIPLLRETVRVSSLSLFKM